MGLGAPGTSFLKARHDESPGDGDVFGHLMEAEGCRSGLAASHRSIGETRAATNPP